MKIKLRGGRDSDGAEWTLGRRTLQSASSWLVNELDASSTAAPFRT